MVFIGADCVETQGGGVFEQVEISVIDLVALFGIEELGIDVHPHRAMFFPEVVGQVWPWHGIKPDEFHETLLRAARTFEA
jgi:hypothetical protein